MNKKKILLLSPFFYPEQISTGKFNYELVKILQKRGHLITVVCFYPFYPEWKIVLDNSQIDNIEIIRGGRNLKFSKTPFIRRIILEISYAFFSLKVLIKRKNEFDLIIPVFPPSFSFFLLKPSFKNKKIVGIVHDLQEIYITNKKGLINSITKYFINKIERANYNSCDKLIFLSEEMKEKAQSLYQLNQSQIFVQYPFISLKKELTNKLAHLFDETKEHIVYSGALGEKQNPTLLYDFFNQATNTLANTEFHFFSNGSEYENLKKTNKNKNIKFHSLVDSSELFELYTRSSVQIIPQKLNTSFGSFPSKLPNIMFSKCKILLITDPNSELYNFFIDHNLETVITDWNYNIFINSLKKSLQNNTDFKNQEKIALQYFTIDKLVNKILG